MPTERDGQLNPQVPAFLDHDLLHHESEHLLPLLEVRVLQALAHLPTELLEGGQCLRLLPAARCRIAHGG